MRVGTGETGAARDIHWHIAAKVWYLPIDKARQNIIWVAVENGQGLTEYTDPTKADRITTEFVKAKARLMDCMDCHNRATHVFQSPQELIDNAMAEGKIDSSLPYIKKQALAALDPPNSSLDAAIAQISVIKDYYRINYPQVFSEKQAAIDQAINQINEVARLTTFPEMNVSWKTYVNNAGHQDSPGCFRCHSKLVATSGSTAGSPIDATCDACHYFQLPTK
jgi:hypothetical protein